MKGKHFKMFESFWVNKENICLPNEARLLIHQQKPSFLT